jgi:poly-gamma-glutamate synthesis protein (capsule biosynthesis protein)
LDIIRLVHQELTEMNVPVEMIGIHSAILNATLYCKLASDYATGGIDNLNPGDIYSATDLVVRCAVNMNTALEVINEYQDQPPSPTPTEVVAPSPTSTRGTPEGGAEAITLALAGDVMLARLVNEAIRANGPLYPWGDVLPLVREADLSLVNLECVIAESGKPFEPPRVFYFRADPEAIEVLALAGVDYVTVSNNHAMDYQGEALLESLGHLDEHDIAHAGAGGNLEEAAQFALLEARGIKVGVVAFADHFREYAATETSPGTNVIPITLEKPHFSRVEGSIQAARAAGADLVVFSIHWGPNMRHVPPQHFKEFARAVMDAGADIFHGHSAHVFQGVEIYKGKPILYDTGDLIDDYYVDIVHKNDQQFLFLVTATEGGVGRIELVPVLISNAQVNTAGGEVVDKMYERMRELSADMGTEVKREGERLVVEVTE